MNNLRNNSLLLFVLGGCSVALLLWLVTASAIIQLLLGLMLVLVLPGYALTEALFTPQQLSSAERLFLTLSASLAIAILGTLLLQQSGWELRMDNWLALFIGASLIGVVGVGLWRRQEEGTAAVTGRLGFQMTHLVLIGLAVILTGVAFTTARSAAPATNYQGYTILWLTPQNADAPQRLQLGITSKELAPAQYKLQIKANDQVAQEWSQLELAPNQKWQATIEVPAEQMAQYSLEAILYRLDQPETPYRHVVLHPAP